MRDHLRFTQNSSKPDILIYPGDSEVLLYTPNNFQELMCYLAKTNNKKCELILENVKTNLNLYTGTVTLGVACIDKNPLIGLVPNGFLVPMALSGITVAFLDRNILSNLEKDLYSSQTEQNPVDLIIKHRIKVSSLLAAIEGRAGKFCGYYEFATELDSSSCLLLEIFPRDLVICYSDSQKKYLYSLYCMQEKVIESHISFLQEIVKLIIQPISPGYRIRVETIIYNLCREYSIQPKSFISLAALSCLYDGTSAKKSHTTRDANHDQISDLRKDTNKKILTPGRSIIKPTYNYSAGAAYNALADLNSLEIFARFNLFPEFRNVYLTHDIGLAAYWTSLHPTVGNSGMYELHFSPALFPALNNDEVSQLLARLDYQCACV